MIPRQGSLAASTEAFADPEASPTSCMLNPEVLFLQIQEVDASYIVLYIYMFISSIACLPGALCKVTIA